MVNWKSVDSAHRLIAAMIAANPNHKDYKAMATFFGEGVTASSIEHQFPVFRKMADELRDESGSKSVSSTPSSAPRAPKSKVNKPPTPSSTKGKKSALSTFATPSKSGTKATKSIVDAIIAEGESTNVAIKTEEKPTSHVLASIEQTETAKPETMTGVVVPARQDDVFMGVNEETSFVSSIRARRSAAPPKGSDEDEYMNSSEESPTSPSRRSRTRSQPRKSYASAADSEDEA